MEELLVDNKLSTDDEKTTVYDMHGNRIEGITIANAFNSGKYTIEYYVDNNNDLKAVFLKLINYEFASDFNATDLEGNEYSLSNLKGKIRVLNFWFTTCKPCVEEIPALNELVKKSRC